MRQRQRTSFTTPKRPSCRLRLEGSVSTKSPTWTLLPQQTFFRLLVIRACRPRSHRVRDLCAPPSALLPSSVSFYFTPTHLSRRPSERVSLSFSSRGRGPRNTLNIGQGTHTRLISCTAIHCTLSFHYHQILRPGALTSLPITPSPTISSTTQTRDATERTTGEAMYSPIVVLPTLAVSFFWSSLW